ncbi:hypothetical protein ACFQ1S_05380, partial [Kibdelosporangium lantanae]
MDVRDTATRTIDDEPALTDEERAALAGVPFAAPASPEVAAIKQSRLTAEDDLSHQIEQHKKDRGSHEQMILVTIRAYRNVDERTGRELDETIESLPALLDLHTQLVTDDLPRAKHKWLRKVDQEMNTQLRSLLVQIDEDGRQIRRGLHPINSVLQGVPFREGSVLTIETVDRPSTDLKEFRDLITRYTSNTLLQDVSRDADEIEAAFVRLRKGLARLDDP